MPLIFNLIYQGAQEEIFLVAANLRREKGGKKIFKCWTCDEYGHYASKCPKREKNYRGNFKPRRDR